MVLGRRSEGYSKVGVWYRFVGKFSREFATEVIPLSDRGIRITKNSLENFPPRLWFTQTEVTAHWQRGYGSLAVRLRLSSGDVTPLFEARNTS